MNSHAISYSSSGPEVGAKPLEQEAPLEQEVAIGGHNVSVVPTAPYVLLVRTRLGGYVTVDLETGSVKPVDLKEEPTSGNTLLSFFDFRRWKIFSGGRSVRPSQKKEALDSVEEISRCSHSEEYVTYQEIENNSTVLVPKKGRWYNADPHNLEIANKKLAEPYNLVNGLESFEQDTMRGFYHTFYLPDQDGISNHTIRATGDKNEDKVQEAREVIAVFSRYVFEDAEKATALQNDLLAVCHQCIFASLQRVFAPIFTLTDSYGLGALPHNACVITGGTTEFTYSYDAIKKEIRILVQTRKELHKGVNSSNFPYQGPEKLYEVFSLDHTASGTTSMELVVTPNPDTGHISREASTEEIRQYLALQDTATEETNVQPEKEMRISLMKITSLSGSWEIDPD